MCSHCVVSLMTTVHARLLCLKSPRPPLILTMTVRVQVLAAQLQRGATPWRAIGVHGFTHVTL